MDKTVDFSIIIPTYNRADKLLTTVNSLLKQTYSNFEVIIVDDGSTDDTAEVIEQIKDERIHYFKKENEERSIARNFGIEKARGNYIGFLDADDYVLPEHLKEAHTFIEELHHPEIIHLGFQFVNEEKEVLHTEEHYSEVTIENLMFENPLHCNAIFLQNEIAKKYHFIQSKDATFAEDWYLWIVLATRYKFHFNNTITSVVVEHEERSLSSLSPQKVKRSLDVVIKELKSDHKVQQKYGKDFFGFAAMRYLFCANLALDQKFYFAFLSCLIKAICFSPAKILARLYRKVFRSDLKGNK